MDAMREIFTAEQINTQAKENVSGLALCLLAHARDRGQPLGAAVRWMGETFAPGWDDARGEGARETAWWVALNEVSGGATLRTLEGDARHATVVIANWPAAAELAFFNLTQDDADTLYGVWEPIAELIGLRYSWRRDGDAIVMTFAAA